MANTWQVAVQSVSYAANRYMIDVCNASASTRYIRIYKLYLLNNQISPITGAVNVLQVGILNAASSGGSAATPIAMDTAYAALNANTTAGYTRSCTVGSTVRQVLNSPDEPAVTTLDWDALGCLLPFALLWDTGHQDSNVEPVVCRPGEDRGMCIKSVTATTGVADVEALFTDAGS